MVRQISLTLALIFHGCGSWEHSTVTVGYSIETQPDAWRDGRPAEERVKSAFKQYTEQNGYQCKPHIKRVEEISCRGPKDLHVTFEPTANKPEFVATFSWVDSADRTPLEFLRQVDAFREHMDAAVADADIRVADER